MSSEDSKDRLHEAERFIPNRIDQPPIFFKNFPGIGTVRGPDALVLVLPGIISFYVLGFVLGLGFRNLLIGVGLSLVPGFLILTFLKPEYKDAKEWTLDYINYLKRPSEMYMELDLRNNREKVPDVSSDKAKTDDTRGWTKIEEIFPDDGIVKLEDEQFVAFIEVNSENLDLTGKEEWNRKIKAFTHNYLNSINDDIQLFVTYRGVDIEDQVALHKKRLEQNVTPKMEEYINRRISWLRNELGAFKQRKTYLVVKVDETDLIEQELDVPERIRKLGGRSGDLKDAYLKIKWKIKQAQSSIPLSDEEKRDRKIQAVKNKVSEHERKIQGVTDGHCEHVTGEEIANLLKSFWEGVATQGTTAAIRKSPIVSEDKYSNESYLEESKRKSKKSRKKKKRKKKKPKKKSKKKKRKKKKRKKKKPKNKKKPNKKKKRKKKPKKRKKSKKKKRKKKKKPKKKRKKQNRKKKNKE